MPTHRSTPTRRPRPALVPVAVATALAAAGLALAPSAQAATSVTTIPNPDAYVCSQPGFVGFEGIADGTSLSSGAISGVQFTTTGGFTWLVADFATNGYNGKYPSGAYTGDGTHVAWLGPAQGAGRIDFVFGPASTFSLLSSNASNLYLDAFDSAGNLLETAGPAAGNINTGRMAELKITRPTADIAYVVAHDSGNFFAVDDICTDAPGVADAPPVIAADNAAVTTDESSPISNTGTYSDADGDPVTLSASVGSVTATGPSTWEWTHTPTDGAADSGTATVTATANGMSTDTTFDLTVANVDPVITSLTASSSTVVSGEPVTFTGTASDASPEDESAGFSWSFDGGAFGPAEYTTSFEGCGAHSVSAIAMDKDGGDSEPATSGVVTAVDGAFLSPLRPGVHNMVRGGRVVPVKISLGCDGVLADGLTPAIQLMSGDVDTATDPGDDSVDVPTISVSNADSSGVMRAADGHYMYNLRVPDGPSGSTYTVRVRPFGTAAGGAMYVVLQLR